MAEPSTGAFTFLFSDIEGSTRRWEQFPEEMNRAVAHHDALLRFIFEGHGGHVFKTIGDAFCVAFPSAPVAVLATLEAQRAIAAQDWGEVGPLRVRMALHTGQVQTRDEDYFGPTVNRVARILGIGHGGQTLISHATYQLVRDVAPAEVGFQEMGEHRLKDLARPERIYQLAAPDLASDFPALKSLNRKSHNLPINPTPLVGREQEVTEILALLRSETVRLVTLSGPGGTGKTRLSLQVAAESLDDFADGVYFVALDTATDSEALVTALAHTLGVRLSGGISIVDGLKSELREKKMLLVLDNFEQITEAAFVVSGLLASCEHIKFLVTSRVVLRLRGEREFPVPPMGLPPANARPSLSAIAKYPAVELFVQRAQAAKANFELDEANGAAVLEICRRVDGLPLAIELAAARIKVLTPQAMLGHLKSRLKLLTGGARDLPERQRTLRNAISWSYDVLEAGDKALFRRMALFANGCTLEAALAVCELAESEELDVFEGVTSLADKSLLRQEDQGDDSRFFMLQTIREYGMERLRESREDTEVGRRHANYYFDLAPTRLGEMSTARNSGELDAQDAEHENWRVALEWFVNHDEAERAARLAIALTPFWERQGRFHEAREFLTSILSQGETTIDETTRARLLGMTGWFLHLQGDHAGARDFQARSLESARAARGTDVESEALNNLAIIAQAQGNNTEAKTLFEDSLSIVRRLNDRAKLAARLSNLGLLAIEEGRYDEARTYLQEATDIYEATRDSHGMAACLCNLGDLELHRQEWDAAQDCSERSLALFRELKDQRGIAYALTNISEAALQRGDYETVTTLLSEAVQIAWETGMQWLVPHLLETWGLASHHQGDSERAGYLLAASNLFRVRLDVPRTEEETARVAELEKLAKIRAGALLDTYATLEKLELAAVVTRVLERTSAEFRQNEN